MTQRGWRVDPRGEGERWHDGVRWTGVTRETVESATRAVTAERAAALRQERRRRTHRVKIVGATLGVIIGSVGLTMLVRPGQITPVARAIGIGRPQRLLPAVSPAVPSSAYVIMRTDASGEPVTYDPCRSVHYAVNPRGAPDDYMDFIAPAIDRAQAATGLKFVYDGLSSDTWSRHAHATDHAPVLLSFTPSLDSPKADPNVVGLGGSSYTESIGAPDRTHYKTGRIALLRSWFRTESAHHDTAAEQAVVMHELGHVIGLDHVRDQAELMSPTGNGHKDYGVGDLAGLAKLGAGHCDG